MKKLFVLLLMFAAISINAQTSVGGGLALIDGDTAIEVNSEFALADGQFSISPSFDYYLGLDDNFTMFTFNVDGHYNLGDTETLNYYPLVGLAYQSFSYTLTAEQEAAYEAAGMAAPDLSSSEMGVNLGGGATYALSENMKLLGELRYSTQYSGSLGFVFGVLFSFGG